MAKSYAKDLWDGGISGKTYNEHLHLLSRVFDSIDAITPLPDRDPFAKRHIRRKGKAEMAAISHEALEPWQMKDVMAEAAACGCDWRDFFLLGAHTGMRLKDVALLEWKSVGKSFIDIKPHKTRRSGNEARIPISPVLAKMFAERLSDAGKGRYVIPPIAEHYLKNSHYVIRKAKDIFIDALGEEVTRSSGEAHRALSASIYSFHSFRATFMSLLAQRDVSARDAMRIMGWESPAMIEIYERELERARGDADTRAIKLIGAIDELQEAAPEATEPQKPLRPTEKMLRDLVEKYSNLSIGRIFDVSSVAVKKWLDKCGIIRQRRIQSNLSDKKTIRKIRAELIEKAN
jgi:integrase